MIFVKKCQEINFTKYCYIYMNTVFYMVCSYLYLAFPILPLPTPVPLSLIYSLYCWVSRVKVVPNDYHDDHFDLRDPDQILGKTLVHANRGKNDIVGRSEFDLGVIYNFCLYFLVSMFGRSFTLDQKQEGSYIL
jgi:hypothetical protein